MRRHANSAMTVLHTRAQLEATLRHPSQTSATVMHELSFLESTDMKRENKGLLKKLCFSYLVKEPCTPSHRSLNHGSRETAITNVTAKFS